MNSNANTLRSAPAIPFNPRGAHPHIDFVTRIQPTIIFVNPDQNPDRLSSCRVSWGSQSVGGNRSRADRKSSLSHRIRTFSSIATISASTNKHCPWRIRRRYVRGCTHQRIPRVKNSGPLRVSWLVPLSHTPRTRRIGIRTITLHFRHERPRRHEQSQDSILPRAHVRANPLSELAYWNFSALTGNGWIFIRSALYERREKLARSIPQSPRQYVYGHMLSDTDARTWSNRSTRESGARHLISWLTPVRLIVSAVEGRLDARCVFVRTAVEMLDAREISTTFLQTFPVIFNPIIGTSPPD
jgi:hypothetical protein